VVSDPPATSDAPGSRVQEQLEIPDVSGLDVRAAAYVYAECGWYVLPVDPQTKHPGSVLGARWQLKTSRDAREIDHLIAGGEVGLALHVGRSGGVAFDVDEPQLLPTWVAALLAVESVPFQSTRREQPGRGHFVFAQPAGADLGNGKGSLQGRWGEVRGRNGIIVVEPTEHEKRSAGGRYHWERVGPVPVLAAGLHEALTRGPVDARSQPITVLGNGMAGTEWRLGRPSSVLKRLAGILQCVLDSEPGSRNETLFWAACRMGELVEAGAVREAAAVAALLNAGRTVGLSDHEMIGAGHGGTVFSGLRRAGRHD
jgi:Bifunctional DNA primase/polymerase, N-terminal